VNIRTPGASAMPFQIMIAAFLKFAEGMFKARAAKGGREAA
jgi:hypothetical protein